MSAEPVFLDAAALDEGEIAAAEALLTPEERAQTARMIDQRRRERLGARLLAARCLSERFGVPPETLRFSREADGRPRTPDLPGYWSVSHSSSLCAFYWAQTPCGVDLERIRPHPARLERLFGDEERRYLDRAGDGSERAACFFRLWTAKEALIKALSLPLSPATFRALALKVSPRGLCSEAGHLSVGRYGDHIWAEAQV